MSPKLQLFQLSQHSHVTNCRLISSSAYFPWNTTLKYKMQPSEGPWDKILHSKSRTQRFSKEDFFFSETFPFKFRCKHVDFKSVLLSNMHSLLYRVRWQGQSDVFKRSHWSTWMMEYRVSKTSTVSIITAFSRHQLSTDIFFSLLSMKYDIKIQNAAV